MIYRINNKEVTKKEMVNWLAINQYYDFESVGGLGMRIANYDRATKELNKIINSLYRHKTLKGTNIIMVGGSISILKENKK